jgi:hypothetical protein
VTVAADNAEVAAITAEAEAAVIFFQIMFECFISNTPLILRRRINFHNIL